MEQAPIGTLKMDHSRKFRINARATSTPRRLNFQLQREASLPVLGSDGAGDAIDDFRATTFDNTPDLEVWLPETPTHCAGDPLHGFAQHQALHSAAGHVQGEHRPADRETEHAANGARKDASDGPTTFSTCEIAIEAYERVKAEESCSGNCCGNSAARVATGSAWRIRRRSGGEPGGGSGLSGYRSMVTFETWSPKTVGTDVWPDQVPQGVKSASNPWLYSGEVRSVGDQVQPAGVAGNVLGNAHVLGTAKAAVLTSGVCVDTVVAAAADAAVLLQVAGGGRGKGRGGRSGRGGRAGRGGRSYKPLIEAVRLQSAARGMLARRFLAKLKLEQLKAAAKARLARREVEERAKRQAKQPAAQDQRQRAVRGTRLAAEGDTQPGRVAAAVATEEVAGGVVKAEAVLLGAAAEENTTAAAVAKVDRQWREWMAAARESAAMLCADALRRLKEAEAARAVAEAAAAKAQVRAGRAEADRAEMEVEWEGRAAALVKQAVAMEQVPELKAPRKLVVLEEWEAEEERGTQTEAVAGAEVGCQTAVFSLKRHDQQSFADVATQCYEGTARPTAAAASQTAPADLGPKMVEVVVGKQLHPAQAKAVERAERAAASLERMHAEAEAMAARYRTANGEAPTVEPPAQKAARGQQEVAKMGGRQARKAQIRRQAAAASMDVLSWTAIKEQQRQELARMAGGEDEVWGTWLPGSLEERLEWAHEDWLARQAGVSHVGEAEASRRFWQAARGAGIDVLDAVE